MTIKFGKRTLFIALFAVFATLCMALAFIFMVPSSQTASADGNNHSHSNAGWSKLTSSNTILSSGNYYLTGSVETNITITGDVTICLNGKTLTAKKSSKVVIEVEEGANFTLCDCSGNNSGKITGVSRRSSNITSKGGKSGGGVFVNSKATFTMYGGTISGNTAKCGGGVYIGSGAKFTMNDGIISGNTVGGRWNTDSYGGGVYVWDGTFIMNGGTISNNTVKASDSNCTAIYGAGGVYVKSGTFIMNGGTISDNTVKASDYTHIDGGGYGCSCGGGVYVTSGTFTMTGGTISGNVAEWSKDGGSVNYSCGGGIYMTSSSTFTMTGGTISNNTAANGGGVYVYEGNTFTMSGGTISDNYTDKQDGGGVFVSGTFTMNGGSISNNSAKASRNNSNAHHLGGGVYVSGGIFTMNGGTISDNSAGWGGAVYTDGVFNMTSGTISDNSSYRGNDDVVVVSAMFNMKGGCLDAAVSLSSSAASISGGYLSETAYESLSEYISSGYTAVKTCHSVYSYIVLSKDDDIETSHSAHDGITCEYLLTELGGTLSAGSYYLGCDVTLEINITISSGIVTLCLNGYTLTGNGSGSVITVENGATLVLYDTSTKQSGGITGGNAYYEGGVYSSDNVPNFYGGGVYVASGGTFIMSGGTIFGNKANKGGGGVYVASGGTFTMTGGIISGNTSSSGGGVYVYGGTFTMNGGTISDNTAISYYGGAGVCVRNDGTFIMNGGTISGNTAKQSGGGVYLAGTFTMNGGTISGNTATQSGGGVYLAGTFTMNGGTISENSAGTGGSVCMESYGGYTFTMNGGYLNGLVSKGNKNTITIYGGYFSTTVYSSIKDSISSQSTAVNLSLFTSLYGTQLYSTDSAYTYAVYEKADCTISNITVTYGESYTVVISGTYVDIKVIYAYDDYIGDELPTEAGTYDVTATIITESSDGTLRADIITFTIAILQKDLAEDMFSITGTYIYNGEAQNATYTYVDTDKDNAVLTESDFDVTYSYNTEAGTATVTFTGKGNYSGEVTLTYEIEKAEYDISGLSLTNKTVTYNGSAQTLTVSGTLPTGVTVTYYYEGTNGTTYEKTTTAPTNAGCYTVTAIFSGDENYNAISSLTADLTIEKASYDTSSLTLEDVTVTYNGEAQAVAVSGLPTGVTVTYYYTGAYSTVYEKSTVAPTDAGIYFVTAVFSGDENYNAISKLTSTLTIEKATVTEKAVQTLNITAHVGDSLEDIELPEGWTWSDTATFSSSGEYIVYATYTVDDNYEAVTTAVTVSVKGYSSSDKLGIAAIVICCATFAVCVSMLAVFFLKKKKV